MCKILSRKCVTLRIYSKIKIKDHKMAAISAPTYIMTLMPLFVC